VNGQRHRTDGPAIEYPNGSKSWWVNGKPHRIDGPADGTKEWYMNGVKYEEHEHPFNVFRLEYNLSKIYEDWPIDMKTLFVLIYG
jgi:hypothetical protein